MRHTSKIAALFLVTSILCSCASASIVDTWRNPTIRAARLQKVLVVSITKKDANRRVYEDMLINELAKRGVEAVAGYTVIPVSGKSEWTVLQKAVQQAAAQAVLTVQTIKVEQQITVQPGYVNTYPGHWYPEAFPVWDLYGYYGSMANYGPAYVSTYDIATMQVNLFDAASGKLLWAATLESSEPEKVLSVGKDLARKVVESLAKEGLI
jgi:predicted phage gp36 major capsid-like protein